MGFEFPWPVSTGGWLAFSSAAVTVLFGLLLLFAPRISLRLLRLQTTPEHPEALAESRATMAGFPLGLGLSCIVLDQPLVYLALGASWGFAVFGRIISMMSDGGNTLFNWFFTLVALVLAALPLAMVFGFVP
ncbi:MAG: DUF4345 family protein [Rhizobiaceae bacterium]